jgi:outer membrane protein assembly factor BamB
MKTKLTLFVTVLAVALFGMGCASVGDNPDAGKIIWKYEWTEGNEPYSWALDSEDNLYVSRYHHSSFVLDGESGKVKSTFSSGLYGIAIGDNGVAYYGARGSVTADPLGLEIGQSGSTDRVKWTFKDMYKGNVHAGTSHLAIGADGTLFVGYEGDIWAIFGTKGTIKWKATPADIGIDKGGFGSVICGKDERLYATVGSSKLICLQASTGRKIWEFDAGKDGINIGRSGRCWAIDREEVIYVGSGREIIALNGETGVIKWKSRINVQPHGAIILGKDGTVYFSGVSGFYALDGKTGDWKWDSSSAASVLGGALGANGTIYVAGTESGHSIMALNEETGQTKWQFKLEDGDRFHGHDGLTVGSNGNIYFATMKAVYSIKGNSNSSAKSDWPMGGQNAQRTNRAK